MIAPFHVNRYLRNGAVTVHGIQVPILPMTLRLRGLANRYVGAAAVRFAKPDIVHETFYEHSILPKPKCPTIVTVHDMIHEKFKANFGARDTTSATKRAAVERADAVICVSEFTRRDLIELFDVEPSKISTIHHGFALQTGTPAARTPPAHRPYLLFVGQRGGHKNFSMLLDAYAASARIRTDFDLVAFGGGSFVADELSEIQAKAGAHASRIHHWSGDDDLLRQVYRDAFALIYPSLYEGFGIPPLEAMSLGCPVLCSDVSSIPEIVGNAGAYFDPTNVESARHAIEALIDSPQLRADLIARGHLRVAAFSYDRCAEQTMAVYRSLRLN